MYATQDDSEGGVNQGAISESTCALPLHGWSSLQWGTWDPTENYVKGPIPGARVQEKQVKMLWLFVTRLQMSSVSLLIDSVD